MVSRGEIYILRVHTNDRSEAIERAIGKIRDKWDCLRSDFEIQEVTLDNLLELLSFKNDVAQFGET